MDCNECDDVLDAWAAGELSGDEAEAVRSHVESCGDCALKAQSYRAAMAALRRAANDTPEADRAFFRGLKRRLDESDLRLGRRTRPPLRWHFVGGVAAAAAAVLIVATTLLPRFELNAPQQAAAGAPAASRVFEIRPVDLSTEPRRDASFRPVIFYPAAGDISSFFTPVSIFPGEKADLRSFREAEFVSKNEYRKLEETVRECQARIKQLEARLEDDDAHPTE